MIEFTQAMSSQPPDGGWGWVVVGASFYCNFILNGIIFSFGILLTPLADHFQVKRSTIAWSGSIVTGLFLGSGPLVSYQIRRFGCRPVSMAGSLLAALGMCLSSSSSSIDAFIVTYGIMSGLGFGMVYLPSLVICGLYFDKKRALATGIALCGSGTGGLVLLPLSTSLLHHFGWQGAIMCFSGLCLSCFFVSILMRPVTLISNVEDDHEGQEGPMVIPIERHENEATYVDLRRDPLFLLMCFSNLFAYLAAYNPFIFLPDLMASKGVTKEAGSLIISGIGISTIVGRISLGAFIDHPRVSSLLVSCLSVSITGLIVMFLPFCSNLLGFTLVTLAFGFAAAPFFSFPSVVLVDLLGLPRLTDALGFLNVFIGLGATLGPPIGGFLLEHTGGFLWPFVFTGILLLMAGLATKLTYLLEKKRHSSNSTIETDIQSV
ncbi:hypothetical protein TCAL_00536 [Tigriopus californicus]|uniref:Major facilitator superfamily (MFS) profile domain-containing protein n=1 Tax=Tigriopus californicus TaxID=6832 RepID=A0A553PAZ2_TIGCA|nr:monocarboxylate transporter 9-like [Tigriopus californicus]XP_059098382.1 monocarboxylate transporter 9-like [Tigriopus californicus]TRY74853.1 hypothetical protein TCAL_00536 [Tigriopus californicus]|eukprot:TCALIF_00536-PA protein Name:"Similar to slc16a12 Monocarboxylate transporter 12 (Xenopus laevis)" AED:0.13 eAED:0.13 QI:0/-1/0/1/-1/1/1/0/432